MSKTKKTVYRVGDTVVVKNPEVFVRCGYPLTKADALKQIDHKQLDEALFALGIYHENPAFEEIKDRVAYGWLHNRQFGGRERRIFTETKSELVGRKFKVSHKKVVKTGTYKPSWGGQSYHTGEYDYEPAYLENEKAHVILFLYPADSWDFTNYIEVEETNVEHYKEENFTVEKHEEAKKNFEEKYFGEEESVTIGPLFMGAGQFVFKPEIIEKTFYAQCPRISDDIIEVVAATRGKARYRIYKMAKAANCDKISFKDIRVTANPPQKVEIHD